MTRLLGLRSRKAQQPSPPPRTEIDAASDRAAREMLVNLRRMRTLRVRDVEIPRADIVAIPVDSSFDDTMAAFREATFTRLPVFDETLDNPLGFVHLKDIALNHEFGGPASKFDLRNHVHRVLYVPPSMPLGALLQRMQTARVHMALVIDEYGGVDGLVTIEDLVEQIVGEIDDEHDEAESALWREESPGVYIASARAELPDFEKEVGVDLLPDDLDEEVDTLGGLVYMLIGRIPEFSEVISHPQGHEFEIVDADARRIKRLRVRLASAVQQAAAE